MSLFDKLVLRLLCVDLESLVDTVNFLLASSSLFFDSDEIVNNLVFVSDEWPRLCVVDTWSEGTSSETWLLLLLLLGSESIGLSPS